MQRATIGRRLFLGFGLCVVGAALGAGCGGESTKEPTVTKQEDPNEKAKSSMDFYKQNSKTNDKKK